MIDVADSIAVYYYHYDGLGSVVALSNSSGNSCQSYVYSAYGRVWAEYPDFKANPFMFTGRRFDYETGLYYYRARYYNPYIGRFLQTDPIGYDDGINWYAYCGNNPIGRADPSGMIWVSSGVVMVLPGMFSPGTDDVSLLPVDADIIGVAVVLGSLIEATTEVTEFIGTAIFSALSSIQMRLSTSYLWNSYIQAVDLDDVNGDGVINESDLEPDQTYGDIVLDTKWVEVTGVLPLDVPPDQFYVQSVGYSNPFIAFEGGVIASYYYPDYVPEEYIEGLLTLDDEYGGEFTLSEFVENHVFWFDADIVEYKGEYKGSSRFWVEGVGYVELEQ